MIGWSKIELCWSVTKQAFDNRFDFYLTGLYKKSMRRQLENFANALSDYSGGRCRYAKGLACRIQDVEELSPGSLPSWETRSIS